MSSKSLSDLIMKEEVCAVNSSISIDYIEKKHPRVDIEQIISEIQKEHQFLIINQKTAEIEPVSIKHLSNSNYWVSNEFFAAFYDKIEKTIDDPMIAYKIGQHSVRSKSGLKYVMGAPIVGLENLLEQLPKEMKRWNKTKEVEIIHSKTKNSFKIKLTHKPHIIVSKFALDYHRGIFDAFGEICGLEGLTTKINYDESNPSQKMYIFEAEYKNVKLLKRLANKFWMGRPEIKNTIDNFRNVAMTELEENKRMREVLNELVKQLDKEKRVSSRLMKFVPKDIITTCVVEDKDPKLITKPKYKTISFCDIRDFATKTEALEKNVSLFLKKYFSATVPPITKWNGEVDKYIGDAIMSLFDSAYEGVHAGIDIREALRKFNNQPTTSQIKPTSIFPVNNGIGIATGIVDIGNVGTNKRMDRTVIGDIVNLAARLEELTKEYQIGIIVDYATYVDMYNENKIAQLDASELSDFATFEKEASLELKRGSIFAREVGKVQVKGRERHEQIYEIMNHDSKYVLWIKNKFREEHEEALSIYYGTERSTPEISEQIKFVSEAYKLFKRNNTLFEKEFQKLLDSATYKERYFIGDNIQDRISLKLMKDASLVLKDIKANPEFYEEYPWDGTFSYQQK